MYGHKPGWYWHWPGTLVPSPENSFICPDANGDVATKKKTNKNVLHHHHHQQQQQPDRPRSWSSDKQLNKESLLL
jgi:hypothetical protein